MSCRDAHALGRRQTAQRPTQRSKGQGKIWYYPCTQRQKQRHSRTVDTDGAGSKDHAHRVQCRMRKQMKTPEFDIVGYIQSTRLRWVGQLLAKNDDNLVCFITLPPRVSKTLENPSGNRWCVESSQGTLQRLSSRNIGLKEFNP